MRFMSITYLPYSPCYVLSLFPIVSCECVEYFFYLQGTALKMPKELTPKGRLLYDALHSNPQGNMPSYHYGFVGGILANVEALQLCVSLIILLKYICKFMSRGLLKRIWISDDKSARASHLFACSRQSDGRDSLQNVERRVPNWHH